MTDSVDWDVKPQAYQTIIVQHCLAVRLLIILLTLDNDKMYILIQVYNVILKTFLFKLMPNISFNSYGHVGMLPPLYGTFTQH